LARLCVALLLCVLDIDDRRRLVQPVLMHHKGAVTEWVTASFRVHLSLERVVRLLNHLHVGKNQTQNAAFCRSPAGIHPFYELPGYPPDAGTGSEIFYLAQAIASCTLVDFVLHWPRFADCANQLPNLPIQAEEVG